MSDLTDTIKRFFDPREKRHRNARIVLGTLVPFAGDVLLYREVREHSGDDRALLVSAGIAISRNVTYIYTAMSMMEYFQ